jgi:hypothetical protein
MKGKTLSQVERRKGDSHFWAGLMEVKNLVRLIAVNCYALAAK